MLEGRRKMDQGSGQAHVLSPKPHLIVPLLRAAYRSTQTIDLIK